MEVKGTNAGSNSIAVSGTATGIGSIGVVGTGDGFGVRGDGKDGHGVMGFSDHGFGVYGEGLTGGTGVVGKSTRWHAVGGFSASVTGGSGVFGRHTAGGIGIAGESNDFDSSVGVLGHSDRGIGVLGTVIHDGGHAGYFSGNVTVNGILNKAAGAFRIDHPLDPANKYLSHSFVESPDMMNIYNGTVLLDGGGRATVRLPGYFGALNDDFRYQLTAIGSPAPNLHIASEIADNQFEIAGGSPLQKVCWQVTGIRHDAFANAHRIQVEEDKAPNERDTYLVPKLFGQPESKGIGAVQIARLRLGDLGKNAP